MILFNQITSAILQLLVFCQHPFYLVYRHSQKNTWFFKLARNQISSKTTFENLFRNITWFFHCSFFALYVAI